MVKGIKFIKNLIITVTVLTLILMVYGFYSVPDELYGVSGEDVGVNSIFSISCPENETSFRRSKAGRYQVNVSLLGAIPIKASSLTVSERYYVVPSGEIFGLRLFTDGIVIVKTESVDTPEGMISPAEKAGLRSGDIIRTLDGRTLVSSSELSAILAAGENKTYSLEFIRDGKRYTTQLTTLYSTTEGKYKAGLWIRDSAAGIGTMTFYEPSCGLFAGLGHGVCDVDTGELLPLSQGDIVGAQIAGCYKGQNGKAGELCGTFTSKVNGALLANHSKGVFGLLTKYDRKEKAIPIAMNYEVKTGKAQIISTVDGEGPKYYDIEITKISLNSSDNKNMVIKVTDEELIAKTGGIVQGMSGSPIIQQGMLVGAVTHVLINEPTKGYGIFARSMMETARETLNNSMSEAS
ncbi:MAG: SpoIVB peptidase [Oscillospiraceae bacterium]|nr:SpoIVB peptidase [Oscillospiraceae bacterium]MDD6145971.1 SpoIVB peptidase [Oscillospiraceae bacterium]